MSQQPPASQPIRVLAIAEACSPQLTSVPLVGYNYVSALASRDDIELTLVTQIRNKDALTADALAQQIRIEYLDTEYIARRAHKMGMWLGASKGKSWTTGTALKWPAYMAFERLLHRTFRDQLEAGAFDLIHRIIPLTITVGSPLASWTKVPMLIGPLNGGLPWPKEYPGLRLQEREWLVPLRDAYRHLPYFRSTYRNLAGVIAGSSFTSSSVPSWFTGHRFYQAENGVDPKRFAIADHWNAPAENEPFQFVTVGRLVPYKGMDLILQAMAGSDVLKNCRLLIVGDGPFRERLEELIQEHALNDSVRFAGSLPQEEVSQSMRASQAFVFPSLREFGGGVVLEAMACGLPTIIVDYGGPAELATSENGILLPMEPAEQLIPKLREAMEQLANDHQRCQQMSQVGCDLVRSKYTWDAKASEIVSFYRQVLN